MKKSFEARVINEKYVVTAKYEYRLNGAVIERTEKGMNAWEVVKTLETAPAETAAAAPAATEAEPIAEKANAVNARRVHNIIVLTSAMKSIDFTATDKATGWEAFYKLKGVLKTARRYIGRRFKNSAFLTVLLMTLKNAAATAESVAAAVEQALKWIYRAFSDLLDEIKAARV